MRAFWWNTKPNIGDRITWHLLRHYGHTVEWAPPHEAEFVGIGSVLEWFNGSTAAIWGAGRASWRTPNPDLSAARVLALRGMATRSLVEGVNGAVLGDPGLLVSDIVPRRGGVETVIIPHWQDQERMLATYPNATFVDVTSPDVEGTLVTIARASRVISSSLHGLVFADSWAIPRMWDWFGGVQAQGFKFRDYFTVMGKVDPGEWYTAPTQRVNELRRDLIGCLEGI